MFYDTEKARAFFMVKLVHSMKGLSSLSNIVFNF